MKKFVKEFIGSNGAEKINEYAKQNNLEIVSVDLTIIQNAKHYIVIFEVVEEPINKYLLNVTFHAGSDDPEDTDEGLYVLETKENYSGDEIIEIVKKVNGLLDVFNEDEEAKKFPVSYDDGLNIETLMYGVGVYAKCNVKKFNKKYVEDNDVQRDFVIKKYLEIEQWQ